MKILVAIAAVVALVACDLGPPKAEVDALKKITAVLQPAAQAPPVPFTLSKQGVCMHVDALALDLRGDYWYVSAEAHNQCDWAQKFTRLRYRLRATDGAFLGDGYMWLVSSPLEPGEKVRLRDSLMVHFEPDAVAFEFWVSPN